MFGSFFEKVLQVELIRFCDFVERMIVIKIERMRKSDGGEYLREKGFICFFLFRFLGVGGGGGVGSYVLFYDM